MFKSRLLFWLSHRQNFEAKSGRQVQRRGQVRGATLGVTVLCWKQRNREERLKGAGAKKALAIPTSLRLSPSIPTLGFSTLFSSSLRKETQETLKLKPIDLCPIQDNSLATTVSGTLLLVSQNYFPCLLLPHPTFQPESSPVLKLILH